MTAYDTLIRGATLTTPEGAVRADLAVAGGRVAAVGLELEAVGARVMDASGLILAPGAIDVHTHFANRAGEGITADDYESGSRAAALEGVTSFVNFAFQEPPRRLGEAVERELEQARGRTLLDFGLHLAITDPRVEGLLEEIPGLAAHGCTSLKVFTAVEGLELGRRDLQRVLGTAAREGLLVYEGYEAVGWPVRTLAGGEVVVEDGVVVGAPGRGRFLVRGRRSWGPAR